MPRARCCVLLVATLAAASFPELTRDGTVHQRTEATPRYDADKCFKRAGVLSFISSNRRYWIHPKRPPTSYSWTPTGGPRIDVPTAAAARRALANHTIVVIGDSLSIQSYASLAALLVCGDGDAARKGEGASIRLLEDNIELRHVDARFGIDCTQTAATGGGAWFVEKGKRKKMRNRGVKSQVFPWGKPGAPPRAVDGVAQALRDFKDREQVTYVVIYGHWFSSRRSDVSFYSKAGKAVAPGPKLYEQTTRVLSRELANGMTAKQRAVFLGFPPIKNAKTGDVCSHDSKWSRAVRGRRLSRITPSPRLAHARRHKPVSPASTRSGTASFSSTSSVRSRACRTRPTPTAARATVICQAVQTSRMRSCCGSSGR